EMRSRARAPGFRLLLRRRSLRKPLSRAFVPGGENFSFAFGYDSSAQFRLSIRRLGLEPGERVARSFCKRPECQPFAQRAIDFCASQSALFPSPDGHIGPRL